MQMMLKSERDKVIIGEYKYIIFELYMNICKYINLSSNVNKLKTYQKPKMVIFFWNQFSIVWIILRCHYSTILVCF